MADPSPSSPESGDDRAPDSIASFDTDPSPGEPEPAPEGGADDEWNRSRWTVIALALAAAVSTATILVARSILADVGVDVTLGETVSVGLVALAVAVAAFIPLRWGYWVVPLVAAAHYALNFYNMLFSDESIYGFVQGSAMGYAVLGPAIGVVVGWVAEGVYRLVAPE